MLKISHLHAGYGDLSVLKDISLELKIGSLSVLMGPNGAGKSTLLKSVFNLTKVTSGKVELAGTDITHLSPHKLLGEGVAFVPQGKNNFGILKVKENLEIGAHNVGDKKYLNTKLEEIYHIFPGLKDKSKEYAFSLSGGEQQMLAISRALMSAPKLLLMDEPSLGLSPKLVKEIFKKIVEIKSRFDTTILIVEHNLKSIMDLADYGYILVQGEIVAHNKCSVLKTSEIMKKVFVGQLD